MKREYEYNDILQKGCYIWGNGAILKRYKNQFPPELDVKAVLDSDAGKWGITDIVINNKQLECVSPEVLKENDIVIIAIENPQTVMSISKAVTAQKAAWCHIYDIVDEYFLKNVSDDKFEKNTDEAHAKLVKFLDVSIPVYSCNLKCNYCYLAQNKTNLSGYEEIYHNEKYIRYALSKKRLGGTAFINFCGAGETMLSRELLPIAKELVDEGHYIQIVTNATLSKKIKEFINSGIDLSKVFFKCSLHYMQLKKNCLLDAFADNVNAIRKAGASITVELVPEDELVPYIDEIKKYSIINFGALPHISVARDESYEDFRILSHYSIDEYINIWKTFESEMFEFKLRHLDSKRKYECMAGLWSGELNIATGELNKCLKNERLCNIYENLENGINFEKVGKSCCLPYCINNHAYISLGLIPDIKECTYADVRDRITDKQEHWLNSDIRNIFSQKLYDNN